MKALLDENLSYRLAESGRQLGLDMTHVTDSNAGDHRSATGPGQGTSDIEIFNWLRQQGDDWIFITQDIAQTRRPMEYHQMRSHRLAVFVLVGKRAYPPHVIGSVIFGAWTEMQLILQQQSRPIVYTFGPGKNLRPLR